MENNTINNDNGREEFDKLAHKNSQLRSAQTLTTIAMISGPVSMIIGGVFLSIVALICAIIAFTKVKSVMEPEDGPGTYSRMLRNQIIFAISISVIALVLNAVSLIMIMPLLTEYLQTGDMNQLMNSLNMNGSSESSSSTSVWG